MKRILIVLLLIVSCDKVEKEKMSDKNIARLFIFNTYRILRKHPEMMTNENEFYDYQTNLLNIIYGEDNE